MEIPNMPRFKVLTIPLLILAAAPVSAGNPKNSFLESLTPDGQQALTQFLDQAANQLSALDDQQLRDQLSYRDAKGNLKSALPPVAAPNLWAHKDLQADQVPGTSTERAYRELKLRAPRSPIIVAVIDSGVDVRHEDLKGQIFENTREIPGNGIDDDGNGKVDDVNGWNFLGSNSGNDVTHSNLEMTRELGRLKRKEDSGKILTAEELKYRGELQAKYDASVAEYAQIIQIYQQRLNELSTAVEVLKGAGMTDETLDALNAVTSTDPAVVAAKAIALKYFTKGATTASINATLTELQAGVKFYFDMSFDPSSVIGDSAKLNERTYGNNHVTTETADHGTHVSGIIGALRDNGIGMDGQAQYVKILPIRAVPDGDERDKDVANAVRYAVDMGARVINMSFGKAFSPNKAYVDAAFRYAEKKGVLVVHAAGNDNSDNDLGGNFPNKHPLGSSKTLRNWVEVGASTRTADQNLPAVFSNYGQKDVDLFAPGADIYSSVPNNGYASFSGTSMASPETAGVAALILSQYPQLKAAQLRTLLMDSTQKFQGLQVVLPNSGGVPTLVDFARLSVTGGVVNAFNALTALRAAQAMSAEIQE
jgi:subtilisin family serine protease